jgi:hypothetical protein
MHSYTSEAGIAAQILRYPGGRSTPKKQAYSTVFDPPQLPERDATEPQIWPNVYLADALLREPMRIVRAQPEQTVAWPKHADASCSQLHMETFARRVRALPSREIYYRSKAGTIEGGTQSKAGTIETRAQSKDLDSVSGIAEAESTSITRAYHTVSGDTTKAPLSTPAGRIMTGSMR